MTTITFGVQTFSNSLPIIKALISGPEMVELCPEFEGRLPTKESPLVLTLSDGGLVRLTSRLTGSLANQDRAMKARIVALLSSGHDETPPMEVVKAAFGKPAAKGWEASSPAASF